jgi:hypothetical protein
MAKISRDRLDLRRGCIVMPRLCLGHARQAGHGVPVQLDASGPGEAGGGEVWLDVSKRFFRTTLLAFPYVSRPGAVEPRHVCHLYP